MIKKNIFTILITLIVIILSVIPIPDNPPLEGVPFIDKWVHFVMYGGVTLAMWMDMYYVRKERALSLGFSVAALICPVVLGGLMEVVQEYLTTYRNGDMLDFYADWFGALLGDIIGLVTFLCLAKVSNK